MNIFRSQNVRTQFVATIGELLKYLSKAMNIFRLKTWGPSDYVVQSRTIGELLKYLSYILMISNPFDM